MTYATRKELVKHFGQLKDSQCTCCGFETQKLHIYCDRSERTNLTGVDAFAQCDLCFSTFAGNAERYPSQYPNGDVLKHICFCTNSILQAIEKK
jgi:hypothetical protein